MAQETAVEAELTAAQLEKIGVNAYIYGYPLVTMEFTRRVMTNVAEVERKYAPVGQFAHLREYPTAQDKEVTAPNADTLYSLAWLDLAKEPMVFTLPDADERYYLMPMLDGWTNVFEVPGSRTTGTKAQTYAITGPNWSGQLPPGVTEYKAPTNLVWILGRTYCDGNKEDYAKVHSFQDGITIVPLSNYGQKYFPPLGKVDGAINTTKPVRDQVHSLEALAYFNILSDLMKSNPPAPGDEKLLADLPKIGFNSRGEFDSANIESRITEALKCVPQLAQKKILGHVHSGDKFVNGWRFSLATGQYGIDYLQRAFITAVGLGANRPLDAIYPISEVDADGKPYDSGQKYVLRFEKDDLPPVNAFWSITMYDTGFFFVPNKLNRYTLGSRTPFTHNDDGSIDIYIQTESPGPGKESNWLPAPAAGKFLLMMRMYWPKSQVVEGKYAPHAVRNAAR